MSFSFRSFCGVYIVTVDGTTQIVQSPSDVWMHSVGKRLVAKGIPWSEVDTAYSEAQVGSLTPKALHDRLRRLPKLPGRVSITVEFQPDKAELPSQVLPASFHPKLINYFTNRMFCCLSANGRIFCRPIPGRRSALVRFC